MLASAPEDPMYYNLLGYLFDSGYPKDGQENAAVMVYRLLFVTLAVGNRRFVLDRTNHMEFIAATFIFSMDTTVFCSWHETDPQGNIDARLTFPIEGDVTQIEALREVVRTCGDLTTAEQRELLIVPLLQLGCDIDV